MSYDPAGGPPGPEGPPGPAGDAATVAAGTTTTGAAGSSASVSNSGTSSAAVFDFTIPRGDKGDKGDKGDTGNTGATGATGSAATIAAGTTTTGAAGTSATVTNSGSSSAAVFDFTIPRGDTGATGATGATQGGIIPSTSRPANRYGVHGATAAVAGTVTANRLSMVPIVLPAFTATRISVRVSTGVAATNVRYGIYNSADDGSPTTLLADCGTTTTTSNADAPITISQSIAGGIYWLACVFDGAPGIMCSNGNSGGLGRDSTSSTVTNILGYYRSFTYGTLPSDETGQTYTNLTGAVCPVILIG